MKHCGPEKLYVISKLSYIGINYEILKYKPITEFIFFAITLRILFTYKAVLSI